MAAVERAPEDAALDAGAEELTSVLEAEAEELTPADVVLVAAILKEMSVCNKSG